MTDLTNDATYNLETGASGGQGVAGANGVGSAQSRAEELAANAAREAEAKVYQARDWALNQSDAVRTHVVDKPFISVGTAFAAGIVFGLLLRR